MSKRSPLSNEACEVSSHDGEVWLNDASGANMALTPEAAEQTGDSLLEESVRARGQRRMKDNPHKAA